MKLEGTPVSVTSCILGSTAMCGLTPVLPFLVNTMESVYWMTKNSTVTAPEPDTPETSVNRKRTSASRTLFEMVAHASMTSTLTNVIALELDSLATSVIDAPLVKVQVQTFAGR